MWQTVQNQQGPHLQTEEWSPERLTQTAGRSLKSLEGYSMRTFKTQGSGTIIYTLKINKETNITLFIKN